MHHLLFITAHPRTEEFTTALELTKELLQKDVQITDKKHVSLFFYSDAAYVANAFNWQPTNQDNLQQAWQNIAEEHHITLHVCVSTAISRGITDVTNSKRHELMMLNEDNTQVYANNLAENFSLVGLGVLAELMHQADQVHHF